MYKKVFFSIVLLFTSCSSIQKNHRTTSSERVSLIFKDKSSNRKLYITKDVNFVEVKVYKDFQKEEENFHFTLDQAQKNVDDKVKSLNAGRKWIWGTYLTVGASCLLSAIFIAEAAVTKQAIFTPVIFPGFIAVFDFLNQNDDSRRRFKKTEVTSCQIRDFTRDQYETLDKIQFDTLLKKLKFLAQ